MGGGIYLDAVEASNQFPIEPNRSCASQVSELIGSCTERLTLSMVIHSSETIIHLVVGMIEGPIQIAEINRIQ